MRLKKILSFILSLVIILSSLSSMTLSAETMNVVSGTTGSGLKYRGFDNNYTAQIEGWNGTGSSDIVIPEKIGNYRVTKIIDYAFENNTKITSVTIPTTVQTVGLYSFRGCTKLKSVTCSGVDVIGNQAFANCTALTSISIDAQIINYSAFENCTSLSSISLSNQAYVDIAENAFLNTAFYNRSSNWINGQLYIGNILLAVNSSVSGSLNIKSGTLNIASCATKNCASITNIVVPQSVNHICFKAFGGCSGLKSITLPFVGGGNYMVVSGVSSGSRDHFGYIFGAESYSSNSVVPSSLEKVILTGSTGISQLSFYCCKNIKEFYSDTVTNIRREAFYGCSALEKVTLTADVKTIDDYAFSACTKLNTVSLGAKHANIGFGAFNGTALVTNNDNYVDGAVYIGNHLIKVTADTESYSVKEGTSAIAGGAFYNLKNFKNLYLPSSLVVLSDDSIVNNSCSNFQRVSIAENPLYCSEYGILYNKEKTKVILKPVNHKFLILISYKYLSGEQALPSTILGLNAGEEYNESVPAIPGYSTKLSTISGTMPEMDLNYEVLYYENAELTSGKCNENISWTLYEDGNLVIRGTGDMPDYTSGGAPWAAFTSNVKEVYIDSRITAIGDYAFENCNNLTYIDYGYSVSSIGKYAFSGCSSLSSFKLPATVTSIQDGAFMGCTGLENVVISDNITTIGAKAFNNCDNLVKVTLGGSVASIGNNAFDGCEKLNQIYFRGAPATLGSSAFGSASGKYVYYYTTIKGWSDVIVNEKWNGYSAYPYDLITKEGFDGTNAFAIKVVDKHNTPLANAVVKLGSETFSTKSNGMAYFVKPTATVKLSVSCSNHRDFSDDEFKPSANQVLEVIELSDKPSTIQGVSLNGKSIATSIATLNCGKDEYVKITVKGYSKYAIVKYSLYQGARLISTRMTNSTKTEFSVKTSSFEEGQTVYVKMYTADGSVVSSALNIDVIKLANISESQILNELSNIELSIGLGSMGSYKVPLTFTANGEEKFYTVIKDRTIRVGINLDIAELFEGEEEKPYKTKLQNMVNDSMQNFAKSKPGFEYNLCGYLEIEYLGNGEYIVKTSYVKIGVAGKLSFNAQASYFGVVGVYFKAELRGEASLDMHITHYSPEQGFGVDDLNFAIENTLTLEGGAYLLWGFGSAGIYGKAQMGFVLGLIPDVEFESVYISGEIGVKWSVLWGLYTGNYKFISGDIYRWPEAQTYMLRMASRGVAAAQQDPNSYEFNPREYLVNRSEWLSGEYLQKNIYDNVAPKTVTCGDTTLMVWLDDNSNRADGDFQTLYYSVLKNGVWSEPTPVCDNGTFDCEFDVYSDGDKIYIVYTEMTSQNTGIESIDVNNENGLTNFANGVEVSVITYQNGKFGTTQQITNNEVCEILPRIGLVDDNVTIVWSETESVGLSVTAASNNIYTSKLSENAWSNPYELAANQNTISDIVVTQLGDGSFTAYIVDSDNNGETNDDRALILCGQNGKIIQLDVGYIMNVETAKIGGENVLLWYNNGKIYKIANSSDVPICLVPEEVSVSTNYQVINLSTNEDLLTFIMGNTDENGDSLESSDIYAVYVNRSGYITEPVRLSNTEGYVQNYSISYLGGELVTVFTETFADISGDMVETVTHFRSANLEFFTDLTLDKVDFDILSAKAQSDLKLTLKVTNNGTVDIDGFTVNIYDKSGELVATIASETMLKSGETTNVDVVFTLPNELSSDGYIVEILPGTNTLIDDAKIADNSKEISVTYADLDIKAEQKIIGEKNYIVLTVTNNGNIASTALLQIYAPDKNGELISSIKITNAIAPGATEIYTVEITDRELKGNNVITCVVVSEECDYYQLNNSETLTIFQIDEDVFVADPDETVFNPELSLNVSYFDKRDPYDIYFFIDECSENFVEIKGITLNSDYTVTDDLVCIKKEFLNTLETGTTTFELVFDFGNGNTIIRTFDMVVSDTRPIALEGAVSIIGDAFVGDTVYADLSGINAGSSYYSIEWRIGGVVVATGNSYTIKPEDYTKRISLFVNGKNGYSGTLETNKYITLKTPEAPAAPIVIKVTSDSVTLAKVDGIEYSLDLVNWQENSVFEGLAPNREYVIYARVKATETNMSGDVISVSIKTPKKSQTRPSDVPRFSMVDYCSITLAFVDGAEYMIEGGEWTDNNVFEDLDYNTTYKFYQRYKETEDTLAGEIRTAYITTLDKIEVSGSISIVGNAQYGATLSVDDTEFIGDIYNVAYQWYCDGVAITGATESTYKVTKSDIGKTLSVTVFGGGMYKGSLSAEIQIASYVLGDVNHDNFVDDADADTLGKFVAKWENITIYEPACDLNNDGIINLKDVTILRRHLAGWKGYEDLYSVA